MDSEEKYITVIIPTYMRPEILEETVPSYFQEYVKEVILVADGGQDLGKLSMVVQKLYNLAKKEGIKLKTIFLKHRVGSIRIINFTVNKINTEFFLIGEDDVLLYPNCIKILIEKYLELSKKEKIGGVVPKLIRHDNYISFKGKYNNIYSYISPFTGEIYFDYQLNIKKEIKVLITHKVLLTKKSIFKEVGGYNEKFSVGIDWQPEWRAENELRSAPTTYILKYWYNIDYKNLRFTFKVEKDILKRSTAIIAWTKWAKMLLLKYYSDLNYEKIQIIPPPVTLHAFDRKPNEDYVTILFLGNDFYRKGGDVALNVFKKLKYKNVKIIIKSNKIPYYYKEYFKNMCNVKIIDYFVNILKLYEETDIFFLPTRADTYSMSLIEANSLGIPAIVSDLLPLREISPFSILCKINDEKAFYEALCFLIENEKERKAIGSKSKQFVEEKFNPVRISLELEKLYRSVIE